MLATTKSFFYNIYIYCVKFIRSNRFALKFLNQELQYEVKYYKELYKSNKSTLSQICNKYHECLEENENLKEKISFYETELRILQTQLIKYIDENEKLHACLKN